MTNDEDDARSLIPTMATNCSATNITLEDLLNLQQFGAILSLVGAISLLPLLFTKLIVPKFRQFPSRLSTLFVLCSLGLNITILAGLSQNWTDLWRAFVEGKESTTFCKIQGIFFQFFAAAEILLWLSIAITMYLVLVQKHSFEDLKRYETRFHLGWCGGACLMTAIPFSMDPAVPQLGTSYCWLTDKNSFSYQIIFLHSEMFLALGIGSMFVMKVVKKLSKVSDSGTEEFVSMVRSYVLRHVLFLLGFSFVFVVIVVFVSNQIMDEHNIWCVGLPLAYAHSMAVSGSGLICCFVLSRVEYFLQARDQCCGYRGKDSEAAHLLLVDDETTHDRVLDDPISDEEYE